MRDGEEFAGRFRPSQPDLSGQASAGSTRFNNLIRLDRVDSTNTYAADAFRAGAREGLVVLADEQIAGRGRRGRQWLAPPGSALLCSILFEPRLAHEDLHLLTSAVALSATEAVQASSGVACSLKWPNDLLVGQKKLAGLLAELVQGEDPSRLGLIVGIGINVAWPGRETSGEAPELAEIANGATSIVAAGGLEVSSDDVLARLLSELEINYQLVLAGEGRLLMDEYRLSCSTIGQRVRVIQETRTFEGRAVQVGDDGRLIVETQHGEEHIDTADVVHLNELGRA